MVLDMPSRGAKIAPRRPQEATELSQRRFREAKILEKNYWEIYTSSIFGFIAYSWLLNLRNGPLDGPREVQDGPKTGLLAPKIGPRAAQEGPNGRQFVHRLR